MFGRTYKSSTRQVTRQQPSASRQVFVHRYCRKVLEAPLSLSPWSGGDEICQHGLTFLCKIGPATVDCRIDRVGCDGERSLEITNVSVSSGKWFQVCSTPLYG